ncbi:Global transcription regulator sge1 [Clarireedia jacksonii]
MGSTSPLSPTFHGHISSTHDALLLFEACLTGHLNHVARRPHDRERSSLIKSGNVFIYEEHSSGIKRWTDGVPWSPSRILGNFLVYRELERPFPPGEKKRANKRNKRSPGISKAQEPYGRPSSGLESGYGSGSNSRSFDQSNSGNLNKETERSLIGSLVDSYGFKEDGLVKKTVSVTVGGVSHHLVSYYTVADVISNKLSNPSKDPRFQNIVPRADLVTKQNFRASIDEVESLDRMDDRSLYGAFPYGRPSYDISKQNIAHRPPMSLPTPPMAYTPGTNFFPNNYSLSMGSAPYSDGLSAGSSTGTYSQFAQSPGLYAAPKTEPEAARSQVSSTGTAFVRRPSTYAQYGDSGMSSGSMDSKLTADSGFASGYYGGMRDPAPNVYPTHRSLPTPSHQSTYDRPPATQYPAEPAGAKDNMWQQMGNVSAGHGHYLSPHQQQWASTGGS